MTFEELLKEKNISAFRLSKDSGVPNATISDLKLQKTTFMNMRVDNAYKIANALDLSLDDLVKLLK